MPEEYATRREVDQLRIDIHETKQSVEVLKSGNAAVAVLGSQLTTVTRDLSELKATVNARFTSHDAVHKADEDARTAGRRWLIGTVIAAIAILAGLYGWVALLIK